MRSLLSLMSKSSNGSNEIIESEPGINKKTSIPSLKTPFDNDRQKMRQEVESQKTLKQDWSSQYITSQSPILDSIECNLEDIDLSKNSLHQIPLQLRNCQSLKYLNIANNQIGQIPVFFNTLQLHTLDLSGNLLKIIPSGISKILTLRHLNLNNNNIEVLCPELFTLKLSRLSIRSNCFISLPFTFIYLLETLIYFDLDWMDHCNANCNIQDHIRQILVRLGKQSQERQEIITFAQFYFFMTNKALDFLKLNLQNQSILFNLINTDSVGLIKYSCNKFPSLTQICDNNQIFPVVHAFNQHRLRCVQILIPYLKDQIEQLQHIFILATKRLDIPMIRILLGANIDPNYQITRDIQGISGMTKTNIISGSSAMHVAMTSFGRTVSQQTLASSVVKLLLDIGCNPNLRNQQSLTPLHAAVKLPSLAAVRFASLNHQFKFGKKDESKNTPLHNAAQLGLVTILQIIQQKQVDPYSVNQFNKTAKQVCIASLQIIKLMRKYENFYLIRILNCQSDTIRNQQKNSNLKQINIEIQKPEMNSVQNPISYNSNPNQSPRIQFRLNLSQVKLLDSASQSSRQQSSQRSQIEYNDVLGPIQRVIRSNDNLNPLLQELFSIFNMVEIIQQKMIVIIYANLIVMKHKLGIKFKSSMPSSLIQILNQQKLCHTQQITIPIFSERLEEYIRNYQKLSQKVESVTEFTSISLIQHSFLKSQLSQNLKYNISNTWHETQADSESFYVHQLTLQLWNQALKGLKIKNTQYYSPKTMNSNRYILLQYEMVHQNTLNNTQFYRTRQKIMDHYVEQKVDNSESHGSLSDRILQYSRKTLFQKKLQLMPQQTARQLGRTQEMIQNISSYSSRRASVQVRQHQGEQSQLFRWDSLSRQGSFLDEQK